MKALMNAIADRMNAKTKTSKDVNKFFIRNAAAGHNVPWTEDDEITSPVEVHHTFETPPEQPKPQPQPPQASEVKHTHEISPIKIDSAPPPQMPPKPPVTDEASKPTVEEEGDSGRILKLLGAGLGVTGLSLGTLLGFLVAMAQNSEETPQQPPAVEQPDDSLYQYLEDQGMHLPPGER